jgi:YD repeat-containing protein
VDDPLGPEYRCEAPKELERRTSRFEKPDPGARHVPLDGGGKTRREVRQFDAYGDLIALTESGELVDPSDDLSYTLDYQRAQLPYLSLPRSIVARGPDASLPPLRERRATFDGRGAIESTTDRIHGGNDARGRLYAGTPATTSYAVDDLGNLFSVVDPLGYTLEFYHDEALATFRTFTIDSFALASEEVIDYRFGAPSAVTDVNGHTTHFDYDDYGRTTSVSDSRARPARWPSQRSRRASGSSTRSCRRCARTACATARTSA